MMQLPRLFSPLTIKGVEIRNRILSTGHDTDLGRHGLPTKELIAYQTARARGGVGLIIVQVVGVHETARYTADVLMGTRDDVIPHFRALFDAIHAEGARAFVQLFHPGRELLRRRQGMVQPCVSASVAPTERFRLVPRELSVAEIGEIVDGYGETARRMAEAGADGVEVVESHGYLPAQFLNARVNRRQDQYGGSLDNRLRFFREVAAAIRGRAGKSLIVGLRISGDEFDVSGCGEEENMEACVELREEFDYFNVIGGTSASTSGAVHIAPPMSVAPGYMTSFSTRLRQRTGKIVFVAGRINQPQDAEKILEAGGADMCGMTRALICDPDMPAKAIAGRLDDIRACIACNQACIGHAQLGVPISCIQNPVSGRELEFGRPFRSTRSRRVMVLGGGPAGMKAAAAAAEAGHQVTLLERGKRLGGKVRLAQLLPHRGEFGGLITNLFRELEISRARVILETSVDCDVLRREAPEAIVLATGARSARPPLEGEPEIPVASSESVIEESVKVGGRVLIYDWMADWTGLGLAEKFASEGNEVTLAVNGICPGVAIQNYVRDAAIARLFKLGVRQLPFMRLYGVDGRTAYLLHTSAQEVLECHDLDAVVTIYPGTPNVELEATARGLCEQVHVIGDALSPRTAEEAVYEGMKVAREIH